MQFVRIPPRKLDNEQDLYSSALRALMRRAHSIHEMKEYLDRRAESAGKELIPRVIARLRAQNYLDDARYALDFARLHSQSRRQGRFRIARELRARGVPDQHIEAALAAVFADTDEASLARVRIKRALARVRGPLEQRKVASIYRSLIAAGFSSDIIRAELRAATRGDVPEVPEISDSDASAES
ncbi:MAG TPA: regulatory protein RecX [Candidatus Acidoferrales bacterium]|nr:regulatory protein RecX [Candidatus Acidoferrales bacterium]